MHFIFHEKTVFYDEPHVPRTVVRQEGIISIFFKLTSIVQQKIINIFAPVKNMQRLRTYIFSSVILSLFFI